LDPRDFRRHGHDLVEWIAEYLEHPERYPVQSSLAPGDITRALSSAGPDRPEAFGAIMADVERVLVPGLLHWNHPGFLGYFAISSSPPAILAEMLSAAFNQQAMLWRTSPAATELEAVSLGWLREWLGLPATFEGVIHDTASTSTMHALAAAREAAGDDVRGQGLAGRPDVPQLAIYCSAEAHSSVDKAAIVLGLGRQAVRRIPVDDRFRLKPDALAEAIAADRNAGTRPLAVVATVGTTSTTSVDPVEAIAGICTREQIWLHVDAAYAGVAAMLPTHRQALDGVALADSIVVNPHKWLFVPVDLSAFYCRRMDDMRALFTVTPDYLKPSHDETVHNLSDTGLALGRRFRALKLWMTLRSYGADGIRSILARHIALAQQFAGWVDRHDDFERLAPVPFSVVCFRWRPVNIASSPEALDRANEQLLDRVNATGEVFLSRTKIGGRTALRLAIGNLSTAEHHVRRAWDLLVAHAGGTRPDNPAGDREAL
jgi:aromatic-L-amino-acid decarboxylase